MVHIELRSFLDKAVLDEILDLIAATTEIEGHRPVGEHKYAHLAVGATGWVGVLARDADRLVGYAHLRWNAARDARPRVAVEIVVHPDYHGTAVAPELVDTTRNVLASAGGGLLYLWVHRVEDAHEALPARMGFGIQRELAFMERPFDGPPPAPAFPPGVTVRPYRPGLDDREFLRVNNAAFAGHPENGGWDAAEFADRRSREWFDPEGLLMAWRDDELLGFHWTKWHGHESDAVPAHERVGEVYVLGVAPGAQGGGLGRALLRSGLRHLYERSCRKAILYVDCASAGAVALYESEGFSIAYREVCYEARVAAAAGTARSDLLRPAF